MDPEQVLQFVPGLDFPDPYASFDLLVSDQAKSNRFRRLLLGHPLRFPGGF